MNINNEKVYGIQEFAKIVGVHPRTLSRWHKAGKFRGLVDSSGRLCYTESLYQEYLERLKKNRGVFCPSCGKYVESAEAGRKVNLVYNPETQEASVVSNSCSRSYECRNCGTHFMIFGD